MFLLHSAGPVRADAQAQSVSSPLRLVVDSITGAATFQLADLLADQALSSVVTEGLPLRLTVRTELWRDRFIDGVAAQATWRAAVVHEPLEGRFILRVTSSAEDERSLNTLAATREALGAPVSVPITPDRSGRYYYVATLNVETLSLSDIEELRRWLRGELGPAVSGERQPESAVGTGMQRFLIRLLGLPNRRFEVRSPTFEFIPPSPPRP